MNFHLGRSICGVITGHLKDDKYACVPGAVIHGTLQTLALSVKCPAWLISTP